MRSRTEVLAIDPLAPGEDVIQRAAAVIRAGGLVAFPTETVYGLGSNALDAKAVERIFAAKGRPTRNPIIVHVLGASAGRELAAAWPSAAGRLADRYWPGPLTLVLPRTDRVPDAVTAGGPTVALRAPAHPVAQALLGASGVPIAAPSANRSTRLSPTRAEHVLAGLDGLIDLVLDGGPTAGGLESTVIDVTDDPPRLLRPGLVPPAEIARVVGALDMAASVAPAGDAVLRSPGTMSRHYAPGTAVECHEGPAIDRVAGLCRQGLRVAWIPWGNAPIESLRGATIVVLPPDASAYGAELYAVLHDLDAQGLDRIVVELPPVADDWLAVRDRLLRASAPR
jgi:L-threonylcarbamoyladenylate synthase